MSIKSYPIFDGSTVTVDTGTNGVPFNDGMNVLSKAINKKIENAGGISTIIISKYAPSLELEGWEATSTVYSTNYTYDGDGTLTTSIGSLSNGVLTVEDSDGVFTGSITASEGNKYAGAVWEFNCSSTVLSIGN